MEIDKDEENKQEKKDEEKSDKEEEEEEKTEKSVVTAPKKFRLKVTQHGSYLLYVIT